MNQRLRRLLVVPIALLGPLAVPGGASAIGINGESCAYNTLAEAIEAAGGDDTIFVPSGTYLEQPGLVDKSLTFRAATPDCASTSPTPVVVDGQENGGGLFQFDTVDASPITVEFHRFHFVDAADTDGGLLHVRNANVLIRSGELNDGDATDNGGCAYVDGGSLTMINSDASGCTAIGEGGAIYVNNGSLVLSNATLMTNSSGVSGGAISIVSSTVDPKNLEIDGSAFDGNQTSLNGGAIAFVGQDLVTDALQVVDTAFTNNSTGDNGGAIYVRDVTLLNVVDSSFENNRTLATDVTPNHGGGAIYASSSARVLLQRVDLIDNVAHFSGGAISSLSVSSLEIVDSLIQGNQSVDGSGAGVYAFSTDDMLIRDSVVIENENSESFLTSFGGGVYTAGGNAHYVATLFQNNESGFGGGIYMLLSDSTLHNCRFIDNSGYFRGGALALVGSDVTLRSVTTGADACSPEDLGPNTYCSELRSNSASEGGLGGAIYLGRSELLDRASRVTVEGVAMIDNSAEDGGEAIYVDSDLAENDVNANNLTLRNVLVTGSGGIGNPGNAGEAIYVGELADVVLESVTIAANLGSALIADGPDATLALRNSLLWDNANPPFASLSGTDTTTECAYSEAELLGSWNLGTAVDPQFFNDPERGDFRLDPLSPLRDVCVDGPVDDLDGRGRPAGASWDAGAFEVDGDQILIFADGFD